MAAVITPISATGIQMETSSMARPRPTAKASMLVATLNPTRDQPLEGSPSR